MSSIHNFVFTELYPTSFLALRTIESCRNDMLNAFICLFVEVRGNKHEKYKARPGQHRPRTREPSKTSHTHSICSR